jgi:hypothetical protein
MMTRQRHEAMYSRISIRTRLTPAEAEHVLERLVHPPGPRGPQPPQPDPRPFVGRVDADAFTFQPVVRGRNNFRPVITGRIVADGGGALVTMTLRLAIAVAVVMIMWIAMAIFAVTQQLPKEIHEGHALHAVLLTLFPLFGILLMVVGFFPEQRKSVRLLKDALDGE